MSGLVERARQAAQDRAELLRERVRTRIARALPGVAIRTEGERVEASGRGLLRRWLARDELRDWREMEP